MLASELLLLRVIRVEQVLPTPGGVRFVAVEVGLRFTEAVDRQ
jgi:hypothetical protein